MAAALTLCTKIAAALRRQSFAVQLLGEIEEVAQIGAIGVMKAIDKFDRSRGVKFATFAALRIRGEILDASRNVGFIRVARGAYARGHAVPAVASLEQLRASWQNDSGKDSGFELAADRREQDELEFAIDRFCRSLSRIERSIVRLYFGLGSGMPLTMKQVAELHGLSESRISQMMSGILARAQADPHFAALHLASR